MPRIEHWTIADVLAESPCLDEQTIAGHFAGRESLTLLDILTLPNLSDEHKVWMACRKSALEPATLLKWRDTVLTRIITAYALPEPSTKAWAESWLANRDRMAAGAAGAAWAAWAAGAAWAARAARAARAAGAAWAAEAAWAAWAARAAGAVWAAWAAWAAEYHTQVSELLAILRTEA